MSSITQPKCDQGGEERKASTDTRELLRRNIESIRKEIAAGTEIDPDVLEHLENELAKLDKRDRSSK